MWEAANDWRDLIAEGAPLPPAAMVAFKDFIASVTPPRGHPKTARHYRPEHLENALHLYEVTTAQGMTAEESWRFIGRVYDIPDTDGSADATVQKMLARARKQRKASEENP